MGAVNVNPSNVIFYISVHHIINIILYFDTDDHFFSYLLYDMLSILVYNYIFVLVIYETNCQDFSSLVDVESLSELPLDSLLSLKKNLRVFEDNDKPKNSSNDRTDSALEGVPEPLALHYSPNTRRTGLYHSYDYEDGKKDYHKKDISTIFQFSVTTLAFLAFGGYLLYLVVMAIKAKNYNYPYDPNTTQIMSAMINAQLHKKKKKKKRPIRVNSNIGSFGYRQPFDSISRSRRNAEYDTEDLYYTLLNLCKGYSMFFSKDQSNTTIY
ncbi:uncharacterized protein LOC115876092 [Sitophilus oryzae]|uniref:Uncharacterized protein LOC115876092 n=1 Tax=Sitophilus oryzae TaxID=7048 RepID=A0A6J2X8Y5_SITOR|nr:uncharacterized protein LOC115876092 [Sitophilus oryzae]